MQKLPIKVLYVENETVVLFSVTEILRRRVENVISAMDGEEGFELYKKHSPDVVITDITMPKMNGLEMARKIKQHNPDIHIYLLSAYPQPDYLLDAIDIGVKGFFKKPLDKEKLFAILTEISELTLLKGKIQQEAQDREIVESALQESETKYQTIFNNLSDAIFVYEITEDNNIGQIIDVNDVAIRYLGYSKEELLNMTPLDFINKDFLVNLPHLMDELKEKKHLTFESEDRTKDGKIIPVEVSSHLITQKNKKYVIAIVRDISERKKHEEELLLHSHVLRNLHDSVIITDLSGNITYINDAVLNTLHYTRDQLIGQNVKFLGEDKTDALEQKDIIENTLKNGQWHGLAVNYTSEGEKVFFNFHTLVMYDNNKKPIALVGISHDITSEKIKEEKLKKNEAFSNALFEYNPVETIVVDKKGKILRYNNSIQENRSRLPKKGDVMYKDYAAKHNIEMYNTLMSCIKNNERKVLPDTVYRKGEKSEKHLHITIAPFPEGAIITSRDITRQVRTEELLKKEIEQKELLIKEINHRVKNNFALVSSLLAIQQQNIEDKKVRDIFEEAQNRIQSIALVHQQLYSSENLANIDFSTYITSLARRLMNGFNHKKGKIAIAIDIKDVALDISKAIPCGLIINELITNAFKHGLKDRENGKITVRMQYLNNDKVEFIIANDGIPFPNNVDFRDTQTLGLQLVTGLVEQIGGTIELDNSKGMKFIITFNI
ncbi:PAS domain S-box protein [bacterium]|nr:MAG: PAS domain S-box protein [bacterium]